MKSILQSSKIDKLVTIIEESTRASEEGVKRFVEPAQGTLRRAISRRHHIVFGRRGSGKSSLLRKAAADLTVDRTPIAFIDLEKFKGHSYPDVLLSVLIVTFAEFNKWLNTAAINPAHKTSFWNKLFGAAPKKPAFNRKDTQHLSTELQKIRKELDELLYSADEKNVKEVKRAGFERENTADLRGNLGNEIASIQGAIAEKSSTEQSREIAEDYQHKKIDFLQRSIIRYQNIFRGMRTLSATDCYLFLDDLYHIRRSDQAQVIDYFHRIAKGNNLWLKIGTIRHRTNWYVHGDPPVGMKLGDDCDQIDLDLTLEKYSTTKSFLTKVLSRFLRDVGSAKVENIMTGGAPDRLVLASGGVARDFLGIFRRSIDIARERADLELRPTVNAEDINKAAGEYDTSKREEFKRDTDPTDAQSELEGEFSRIQEFCLNDAQANIFLIDQSLTGKRIDLINELVDLRLVHLVRSRITVSGQTGKLFRAYMLDVSQYAGARKRRGLTEIKFWDDASKEHIRRISYIYQPLVKSE